MQLDVQVYNRKWMIFKHSLRHRFHFFCLKLKILRKIKTIDYSKCKVSLSLSLVCVSLAPVLKRKVSKAARLSFHEKSECSAKEKKTKQVLRCQHGECKQVRAANVLPAFQDFRSSDRFYNRSQHGPHCTSRVLGQPPCLAQQHTSTHRMLQFSPDIGVRRYGC